MLGVDRLEWPVLWHGIRPNGCWDPFLLSSIVIAAVAVFNHVCLYSAINLYCPLFGNYMLLFFLLQLLYAALKPRNFEMGEVAHQNNSISSGRIEPVLTALCKPVPNIS